MNSAVHAPVMLSEVLSAMAPRDGETYVDATFGAGGYSRALLEAAACRVLAIDRDPEALARGQALLALFPDRLRLLLGRFGDLDGLLRGEGVDAVDGVAMDVGVSSPQLDDPSRGFSFREDGPLDMRMGGEGPSAADLVNECGEQELARILWELGEERQSRAVARRIVAARAQAPITRTAQLADIIRSVVRQGKDRVDPATRSFQALRIKVNDELGELERGLRGAETLLRPGGRLVVVSFHSLEDRIVKTFLNSRAGRRPAPSRHAPPSAAAGPEPSFELVTRKPLKPDASEVAANPRARSARLRAARRTRAPAFPDREAA